jgi:hypothetical protein
VSVAELDKEALQLKREIAELGIAPSSPAAQERFGRKLESIRRRLADHLVQRMIEKRPEVISHGRPTASKKVRQGQHEARTRLEQSKRYREACSDCPAANVSKTVFGLVVHCGIEGTRMTSQSDPQSLLSFCLSDDYTICPSWRTERQAYWDIGHGALYEGP